MSAAQKTYAPRSFWQKILPLLLLLTLYFVVIFIIGMRFEKIVSAAFIIGLPIVLGAAVAYVTCFYEHSQFTRILRNNFLLYSLIVLASVFILKEGVICLIIMTPVFLMMMVSGSALMYYLCLKIWQPKLEIYSIALIPLIMMGLPSMSQSYHQQAVETIVIRATPEQIWHTINQVDEIKPSEFQDGVFYRLGAPAPYSAVTVDSTTGQRVTGQRVTGQHATADSPTGLVRKCQWGKGIYFDEPIQVWQPNRYLRWQFKFYPDSVPTGALDEHVKLGGKFFQLHHGAYRLTPIDSQHTRLTFEVSYSVHTEINPYAQLWADWVMRDFSKTVLRFYQQRLAQVQPVNMTAPL